MEELGPLPDHFELWKLNGPWMLHFSRIPTADESLPADIRLKKHRIYAALLRRWLADVQHTPWVMTHTKLVDDMDKAMRHFSAKSAMLLEKQNGVLYPSHMRLLSQDAYYHASGGHPEEDFHYYRGIGETLRRIGPQAINDSTNAAAMRAIQNIQTRRFDPAAHLFDEPEVEEYWM